MESLKPIEQNTMLKIYQFYSKNGYMPTQRELASALDISNGAIQARIAKLTNKGYLTTIAGSRSRNMKFANLINANGKQIPVLGVVD